MFISKQPMGPSILSELEAPFPVPGTASPACVSPTLPTSVLTTRFTVLHCHLPPRVVSTAGYKKNQPLSPGTSLLHGQRKQTEKWLTMLSAVSLTSRELGRFTVLLCAFHSSRGLLCPGLTLMDWIPWWFVSSDCELIFVGFPSSCI